MAFFNSAVTVLQSLEFYHKKQKGENTMQRFITDEKNRYPIRTHRRLLLSLPDSRGKSSPFKIRMVAATIFEGT